MTPSPDLIRADVAQILERHGINPRRALKAALRLVRGLALDQREQSADRDKTLIIMRDRIADLLQDNGVAERPAASAARRVIDWLRRNWGGRMLTRQWWGFQMSGLQATGMETDGELIQVESDPVKSRMGRELRAVVWMIVVDMPRPCHMATEIAALIEREWSGVYVPLGEDLDRQERDREVYKVFAGLGSMEKVTALGVSQSSGYEIYKRLAADKEKREQPGLPGVGGA